MRLHLKLDHLLWLYLMLKAQGQPGWDGYYIEIELK